MGCGARKKRIEIPYQWETRDYQWPLWDALDGGYKRAVAVWHRRAGKDITALNRTVMESQLRVGTYYHLLPTYNQGRKIVWDGMDRDGRPFLDYWPQEIIKRRNESEMQIELINGSIWQVVGTDNVDRLVGTNPVGCVFSEYSLHNPKAWEYLRPILRENDGWAIFIYTPRGRNHGYNLLQMAQGNPDWYVDLLTVDDTGVITANDIALERAAGMSEEMINQEFYCSFYAPQYGAYYGTWLTTARNEGRICKVSPDPVLQTHTFWDLGIGDQTAIWWLQVANQELHLIDYYEMSGEGLAHYARVLDEKAKEHKLIYGEHWAPHDIGARELGSGLSRKDTAKKLGINFRTTPMTPLMDGIEQVRNILHRCWFDEAKCDRGLSCLESYRKEWIEKLQTWAERPLHDEYSHGADAFRTMAVALKRGAGGASGASRAEIDQLRDVYRSVY